MIFCCTLFFSEHRQRVKGGTGGRRPPTLHCRPPAPIAAGVCRSANSFPSAVCVAVGVPVPAPLVFPCGRLGCLFAVVVLGCASVVQAVNVFLCVCAVVAVAFVGKSFLPALFFAARLGFHRRTVLLSFLLSVCS